MKNAIKFFEGINKTTSFLSNAFVFGFIFDQLMVMTRLGRVIKEILGDKK